MSPRYPLYVGALAALGLSISAAETHTLPGDRTVSLWFQGLGGGWLETFMRAASQLGETVPMFALLAAAVLVLIAKSHRAGALALPLMAAGAIMIPILKEIINRPRPSEETVAVLSNVGGYSFPSGHAFLAITVFGALFYMADRLCGPNRNTTLAFRGVLVFAVLAIGASRVYLGVHWTSDVVGGYLLGGLALFMATRLFERVTGPARVGLAAS